MTFGADTTTDEVLEGIDLVGKRALVTGASGGLGEETARALASKGAAVTIAARDMAKAEAARQRIIEAVGECEIDLLEVELSQPDSVRKAAAEYLRRYDAFNILINNAGVMACPLARTVEGWEMQLATNHFGHFLFTCLLVPALKAGCPARIINLSSAGHRLGTIDFDDPHFDKGRAYDKWTSYGQAKTANILFSVELEKRLASSGIHAIAVHPGGIQTDLGRHLVPEDIAELMSRANPDPQEGGEFSGGEIKFKSVPAGAATSVWTATSPELEGRGGIYCEDCNVAEVGGNEFGAGGVAAYAVDGDTAAKLWTMTEDTLGEKFDLS